MVHRVFDYVAGIAFICSILHTLLPPWDIYADFPRFQKYYKVFIYTIGYFGANARSLVHPGLSTEEGTKPAKLPTENPSPKVGE